MSDHDALPLHDFREYGLKLPNSGRFTSFERHVPSLLSGSAQEWFRMADLLIEQGAKNKTNTPSDMHAMLEAYTESSDAFESRPDVVGLRFDVWDLTRTWDAEFCKRFPQKYLAVHVSHNLVKNKLGLPFEERPAFARQWLRHWMEHCGRKPSTLAFS